MIDKTGTEEMEKRDRFVVIHPLDDAPEEKVDIAALGPMPMTRSVRLALFSLRAYLILMLCLVGYHVCGQAGFFGLHVR
jgi:hypothetical protein